VFDLLLHQGIRSKIISYLIKNGELPFVALKKLLGVTGGNLSSHLKKLEEGGYVKIDKFLEGKKTKTIVSVTKVGRDAFKDYIIQLREFVEQNFE